MRQSSISRSVLAALAAAGIMATPTAIDRAATTPRGYRAKAQRRIQPRFTGRSYPEQSSRQALRKFRRAQGGPGIELVGNVYQPRA